MFQVGGKDAHAEGAWNCIAIFEQDHWRLEMMSTELVTSPSRCVLFKDKQLPSELQADRQLVLQ